MSKADVISTGHFVRDFAGGIDVIRHPVASSSSSETAHDHEKWFEPHFQRLRRLDRKHEDECKKGWDDHNVKWRLVLFEWMFEVANELLISRKATHLAFRLMDRFLGCASPKSPWVKRNNIQLMGSAAFLVACKLEEIFPPIPNQFSRRSGESFDDAMLCKAELELLQVLKWDTASATAVEWVDLFFLLSRYDARLSFCTPLIFLWMRRVGEGGNGFPTFRVSISYLAFFFSHFLSLSLSCSASLVRSFRPFFAAWRLNTLCIF